MDRPILITGIHRCGSTWVGEMLNLASNTQLIYEPFNLGDWSDRLDDSIDKWYQYLPGSDIEEDAKAGFSRILKNRSSKVYSKKDLKHWFPFLRRGRQLIKDPIASLSSEWLYQNFDIQVVVIVRHPIAFARSLERMKWYFDFDEFISQEGLMENHLYPFKMKYTQELSELEKAAVLWESIYSVLDSYIQKHPSWVWVRHEDLSLNPIEEFEKLYNKLDLEWSPKVFNHILKYTSSSKVDATNKTVHQLKRNSSELAYSWIQAVSSEDKDLIYKHLGSAFKKFYPEK